MAQKTVLVTGSSAGGIGDALARQFQSKGYHVFATVRSLEKGAHLASLPSVELIILDVTDADAIAKAVKTVESKTGGKLDVLVNNSGGGYTMPLLDSPIDDGRRLFDLNVWSVLSMVQAFSPLLIASKGCILNIGSIGGVVPRPWMGLYHASKAATNMMSECLRNELDPLGVRVITGMVGEVKTNFFGTQAWGQELPPNSRYKVASEAIERMATGQLQSKQEDADVFARYMVSQVDAGATGPVWKGGNAGSVKWASALLPTRVFDRILRRGSDLDKVGK